MKVYLTFGRAHVLIEQIQGYFIFSLEKSMLSVPVPQSETEAKKLTEFLLQALRDTLSRWGRIAAEVEGTVERNEEDTISLCLSSDLMCHISKRNYFYYIRWTMFTCTKTIHAASFEKAQEAARTWLGEELDKAIAEVDAMIETQPDNRPWVWLRGEGEKK